MGTAELNEVAKDIIANQEVNIKEPPNYYRYIASFVLLVTGFALMCEHLITWGGFDRTFGHEIIGIGCIILSYFIGLRDK